MTILKKMGLLFLMSLLTYPALAAVGSVAQLSNSLMGPVSGLARVMHAIAFVSGVAFLLGALLQYKYHRDNPQQVRLSTPIALLAIGIALVAIPIITMWSEAGKFIQ